MNWNKLKQAGGYSLLELVVVIVLIAILASIAMGQLKHSAETARLEQTRAEMGRLATAIVGDASLVSAGNRTDFGYVGDVGSLPGNLDALVSNPGYATWKGPYIRDAFSSGTGTVPTEFKFDAWGKPYVYSGAIIISSTGSGTTITRQLANSTAELLSNSVTLTILNINDVPPGPVYVDSVDVILNYPNGTGGMTAAVTHPAPNGSAAFTGIPVGRHSLYVVYLPTADTLRRMVTIDPNKNFYAEVTFHEKYW